MQCPQTSFRIIGLTHKIIVNIGVKGFRIIGLMRWERILEQRRVGDLVELILLCYSSMFEIFSMIIGEFDLTGFFGFSGMAIGSGAGTAAIVHNNASEVCFLAAG